MTMKAQVLYGPKDLRYEEVKKPACPKDGILIKVLACGICGSDLRTYLGGSKRAILPSISGHEIAGEVVESNNAKFPVGSKVSISPVIACGKCVYCVDGLQNLCDNLQMIGTASGIDGGFAEYAAFDGYMIENGCFSPIPEGFDPKLTVLSETASSVLNAQININLVMEELVVVIGSGTIGCLHSEIAKLRGCKEVMLVEMNKEKAEFVEKAGFGKVYPYSSSDKELYDIIMEKTQGRGADVVISACPAAQAQADALRLVKKNGKVVLFGGINAEGAFLDTNLIHYREINVHGANAYTPKVNKLALDLILSGQLDARKYISKEYKLEDLAAGYEDLHQGRILKGIVVSE